MSRQDNVDQVKIDQVKSVFTIMKPWNTQLVDTLTDDAEAVIDEAEHSRNIKKEPPTHVSNK